MGNTTPLIKAQSNLPALGRSRPGQPGVSPEGPYRAAFAFGTTVPKPAPKAGDDQDAKLQAELQVLRRPQSGKPGEPRSWSYLATEGGKAKAARRGK